MIWQHSQNNHDRQRSSHRNYQIVSEEIDEHSPNDSPPNCRAFPAPLVPTVCGLMGILPSLPPRPLPRRPEIGAAKSDHGDITEMNYSGTPKSLGQTIESIHSGFSSPTLSVAPTLTGSTSITDYFRSLVAWITVLFLPCTSAKGPRTA